MDETVGTMSELVKKVRDGNIYEIPNYVSDFYTSINFLEILIVLSFDCGQTKARDIGVASTPLSIKHPDWYNPLMRALKDIEVKELKEYLSDKTIDVYIHTSSGNITCVMWFYDIYTNTEDDRQYNIPEQLRSAIDSILSSICNGPVVCKHNLIPETYRNFIPSNITNPEVLPVLQKMEDYRVRELDGLPRFNKLYKNLIVNTF
jgi:hypothetical protein